jgi:hypothetical protein
LEATALDDAVELSDALATDIFVCAEEAHRKSRPRSLRDLDAAAIMLRDVGRHVVADEGDALPVAEWRSALFERIARAAIQAAMANVYSLVIIPDDRRYRELRPHWRRVRTLFSALLRRTTFDAAPAGQPVVAALDYLRGLDDWTHACLATAPTAFLGPAWKRHVLDGTGRVADNRAYVFAGKITAFVMCPTHGPVPVEPRWWWSKDGEEALRTGHAELKSSFVPLRRAFLKVGPSGPVGVPVSDEQPPLRGVRRPRRRPDRHRPGRTSPAAPGVGAVPLPKAPAPADG